MARGAVGHDAGVINVDLTPGNGAVALLAEIARQRVRVGFALNWIIVVTSDAWPWCSAKSRIDVA
jgi:hypothetical protein